MKEEDGGGVTKRREKGEGKRKRMKEEGAARGRKQRLSNPQSGKKCL